MLNYNLRQLSGPQMRELRVKEPAKYGWQPRALLTTIVDIYLHLHCPEFARAIAADEVCARSFFSFYSFEFTLLLDTSPLIASPRDSYSRFINCTVQ